MRGISWLAANQLASQEGLCTMEYVSNSHIVLKSLLLLQLSLSYTYLLTYLLTPWSRVLLEKLIGFHLVKKFPSFYGTRRFITAFTSPHHLSLSWGGSIHSTSPNPTFWRSILILSPHLRLGFPSGLFPSGFPTKTLYTPLISPLRTTCHAHLVLLDFNARTILGEEYLSVLHCSLNFVFLKHALRP